MDTLKNGFLLERKLLKISPSSGGMPFAQVVERHETFFGQQGLLRIRQRVCFDEYFIEALNTFSRAGCIKICVKCLVQDSATRQRRLLPLCQMRDRRSDIEDLFLI